MITTVLNVLGATGNYWTEIRIFIYISISILF